MRRARPSDMVRCRSRGMKTALALFILLCASAAPAKPATASERKDTAKAVETMDRAVACLFKRNPGRVRAYLASVPGSREEAIIASYFFHQLGWCLSGGVTRLWINGSMARGIAAEHVLVADFPGEPRAMATAFDNQSFGPLSKPLEVTPEIAAAYDLARCAVQRDMAGVARLIGTRRGSAAEGDSVRVLTPTLSACVVAGATFSTDRDSLRAFLAEALYQVVRARQPSHSSSGTI
jgi:hypothetical protein